MGIWECINSQKHAWLVPGYKLYIITNDKLEMASVLVTPANFSDVKALEKQNLLNQFTGLSLVTRDTSLQSQFTSICLYLALGCPYLNKYYGNLLSKRRRIERVFAYLKRSLTAIRRFARTSGSFIAHVLAAVIAYIMRFTAEDRLAFIIC